MLIQLSDQAIACQDNLKIKQFASRTQSISGVFNALFTVSYGVGYNYLADYLTFMPAADQTDMNLAAVTMADYVYNYFSTGTLIDCQDFGYYWGVFVSEFLEARIDTTVAFIEVQTFA